MAHVLPAAATERAGIILAASARRQQIEPFTDGDPAFDVAAAYRVGAAILARRKARGERPVGRKVGFTNRTIWDEYGVHAPIWGCVYDTTVLQRADTGALPVGHLLEPRIEPEIMFRLARPPRPGLDERALLSCIDQVSHGFEIVQSVYPGWRFRAADTVAAYALHGALMVGPAAPVDESNAERWFTALAAFDIALACDGTVRDRGTSANVLDGGPLAALRHLVEAVAGDPDAPPLQAGEIISTGTLTRALPVKPGETWSTQLEGIGLPGMTVTVVA